MLAALGLPLVDTVQILELSVTLLEGIADLVDAGKPLHVLRQGSEREAHRLRRI